MRGRVVRSLRGSAVACLIVVLLVAPAGALPLAGMGPDAAAGLAVPPGSPSGAQEDPFAWMGGLSVEMLEQVAPREAERFGPSPFPRPDALPGYGALAEGDQQEAWRNWLTVSALASVEDGARLGSGPDAAEEPAGPAATAGDLGPARALRGLWSLESHGVPREMHAADDAGATFVVTDRGVLRFPAPGAAPDWMVKPGSYLGNTATTDANGDGVLDIVIGVWGFYSGDEPSIVVVDGTDGAVLFSGLVDEERLMVWTLTDVDGDGKDDLLGVDGRLRLIAYRMDGSEIYAAPLPGLPSPPVVSLPLVYLWMYYSQYAGGTFADVDGDGVQDLVVMNGYRGSLFVGVVFQQATAPMMTALSGVDGTILWQTLTDHPLRNYSWSYPVASGDLDGDGRDDILLRTTGFTYSLAFTLVESMSRVHSGVGGTVLTDDGYRYACALVLCTPMLPEGPDFFPVAFADLDDDGAEELLGVGGGYADNGGNVNVWVEGRTTAMVPGGPSQVAYRHDLVEGTYDEADVMGLTLRDTDGDGVMEALVSVFTARLDDEGVLEALEIHHFIVDGEAATGGPMPGLYGFWDYDATGTGYVWSVDDDRWGPIDADGARMGEGFRLIVSMVPYAFYDHTDDQIPDLLLRKSLGYMWVDGKTGRLLEDVVRPITVDTIGVYEQDGRLYVLERDHERDDFALVDVETAQDAWRIARDTVGGFWISDMEDVTGDGTRDLLVEDYRFVIEESSDGPLAMTYAIHDERSVKVLDPATEEVVWEREMQNGWVYLEDALPSRAGHEILVRERDEATSTYRLELHATGEDTARWTHNLGSGGHFVRAADGYILTQNEQEGAVYEILVGETGELVSSYPLPADTWVMNVFFTKVNGDRFPDLVTSFVEEGAGDDQAVEVVVHDWANEKELARFALISDGEESARRVESGLYLHIPPVGFASAEVGDWDRDGLVDFAYREADRALIRSTATGDVLALAPGAGTVLFTPDLNDDGRTEIGMVTDTGRLRFFAYAPGIGELSEEDEAGVRVVKQVNGTETDEGAADFFAKEEGTVPAAGLGLVVFALALVAMVLRRRR